MFKAFKRRRLIRELLIQYEMMSISLKMMVGLTECYMDDCDLDKKCIRQKIHYWEKDYTIREIRVRNILKELEEL